MHQQYFLQVAVMFKHYKPVHPRINIVVDIVAIAT